MSLSWSKIAGTQLGKFILGLTGVTLKNNNGNLDVRNNDDSAYANVSAKNVVINDSSSGYKVTLSASTATQLDYSLTLPTNAGSPNEVLTTDGAGNLSWSVGGGGGSTSGVSSISGGTSGLLPNAPNTGTVVITGTLAILHGGTGATTATDALTNLGAYPTTNPAGYTTNTGTVTSIGLTSTDLTITDSPISTSGTISLSLNTVPISKGGTGATTAADALTNLGAYPATNPAGYTTNTGTVISVDVSGGVTGLLTSGGPITTTGTITLGGTLSITNGGTGATTATDALTNLGAYPATNPAGYTTNTGTVTSVGITSTDLTITGSPISTSGTFDLSLNTVPISKGGTGATGTTAAFNALSPATATGDLIYFDGTNNVRLGIGTNGQVLTANNSIPNWADPTITNRWMVSSTNFSYLNPTTATIVELPANTLVDKVTVIVDDAFVSAGSFQVSVGTPVDQEEFVSQAEVITSAVGRTDVLYSGLPNSSTSTDINLYTYGTAFTGSGRVMVSYSVIDTPLISNFSGTPLSGSAPLTVTFTDSTIGSPTSWLWDFKNDGTATSTQQNPSYTYSSSGIYSVKLTTTRDDKTSVAIRPNYVAVSSNVNDIILIYNIPSDVSYYVGFELLSVGSTTPNCTIVWGDGTTTVQTTPENYVYHNYGSPGVKIVAISGTVPSLKVEGGRDYLTQVVSFGNVGLQQVNFGLSPILTQVPATLPSTITNVNQLFLNCENLNDPNIANWDVSNVTDMTYMFSGCSSFNQNIGNWDVSNVTSMNNMFYGCSAFNQNIGNWNVSNVTNMYAMFGYASVFNQDLSSWCVSQFISAPTNFDQMAYSWILPKPNWGAPCPSNNFVLNINTTAIGATTTVDLPLYGTVNCTVDWGDGTVQSFNTPGDKTHTYSSDGQYTIVISGTLTQFGSEFSSQQNRSSYVSVTEWGDLLGLTSLSYAFHSAYYLTSVPSTIPATVTDTSFMFWYAQNFNHDIGGWDTSNVTNMNSMFYVTSSFNQNIGNWNVSNVTNMGYMFGNAYSFNQPIGNWNVSSVTNMDYMFSLASSFNQDLSDWCVTDIPTEPAQFSDGANSWTLPKPVWGTCLGSIGMIINIDTTAPGASTTVGLPLWGTVNCTIDWGDGTVDTVNSANSYTHTYVNDGQYSIQLSGTVTEFGISTFGNESYISVSKWSGLGLTSLNNAFANAYNLVSVPNSIPSSVTNTSGMFAGCSSFDQDISGWDVSNVTNMVYMFQNASSFNNGGSYLIDSWNVSAVLYFNFMFAGATAFNQPLGNWNVSSSLSMPGMFAFASSFNQDLSTWCVQNISSEPMDFSLSADNWTLPKPVWGTCPSLP